MLRTKNLITILLFSLSFVLMAQNAKQTNDIEYQVYMVEAGEGLYSISKKFGVTQEQIITCNPQAKDGIKAGQTLLIPVANTQTKNSQEAANQEFISHVVTPKQTLYAISQKYNVSQDDIIKYNPAAKNGLLVDMVLQIPKNAAKSGNLPATNPAPAAVRTENSSAQSNSDSKFFIHTVEQGETLSSICRMHAMDIKQVIRLNPGAEKTLRVGDKLILPVKEMQINTDDKRIANEISDASSIKIAFLLPYMLQNLKDATNDRFLEFYAGALLAISEARQQGVKFKIYAYDTEKSESKIMEILAQPELKKVDLIVGPAYSNQIQAISDFAKNNNINTLIPFSANVSDINNNPFLFQFNPSQDVEAEFTAEWCKNNFANKNILLAYFPKSANYDSGNSFLEKLENCLIQKGIRNYQKIENISAKTILTIDNNRENIVFFNSDKLSQVQPFFAQLDSLAQFHSISLYKQYSWQLPANRRFKFFSISPFIPLDESPLLSLYNTKFRNEIGWQPTTSQPRYDILGYDLTTFFISKMKINAKHFSTQQLKLESDIGIQSEVRFERSSANSGFINHQLYYSNK
ncbi:MAG: LysM peptidoglycan-binding domain-containing protein [Paludibacter sp.]|nr:LysM peptidoglycan-binding domain-containing protein [Paludibacter sp.]